MSEINIDIADGVANVYVVESPTRIRLHTSARELARLHNMSDQQMAAHLLNQHALRKAGHIQREGEN